jgi:hypothetical protein
MLRPLWPLWPQVASPRSPILTWPEVPLMKMLSHLRSLRHHAGGVSGRRWALLLLVPAPAVDVTKWVRVGARRCRLLLLVPAPAVAARCWALLVSDPAAMRQVSRPAAAAAAASTSSAGKHMQRRSGRGLTCG